MEPLVKTNVNHITLTTDANNRATLPGNMRRYALIIANGSGVTIRIQWQDAEPAGQGIPLPTNSFLQLPGKHYGDGIQQSIFLLGTAAGQIINAVEFIRSP